MESSIWPHLENWLNWFYSFKLFAQKSNVAIKKIAVKKYNHLLISWIRQGRELKKT